MPRSANVAAAQIKAEIVVTAVSAVTAVITVMIGVLIAVMIVLPPMAVVVVAHCLVVAGVVVEGAVARLRG
jgi:hypothetical protein